MKRVSIIIFNLLIPVFTFAQVSDQQIISATDALVKDAVSKGIFSGTVFLAKEGKEIYKKQSGFADWNSERPINDGTTFNIGSLNKQFTEEMIHQLVKEGKLSYDSALSNYLDLFPAEIGNKITINQLLNMRSGLGDYMRNPVANDLRQSNFDLNDLLQLIKNEPLLFEPGTSVMYSNSGYVVLGGVIEKVTGKSYEENLDLRIMQPLRLVNIYYSAVEKRQDPNRAYGTNIDFSGTKKSLDDVSNSAPDGGIYTDYRDLFSFTEAKRKNLLPSGKIYEPGVFAGGTERWNAVIGYTARNYTFIIMCNMGNIADELASRISSILKGEKSLPLKLPFEMSLFNMLNEKGIGYVEQNIKTICEEANRNYDDRFLNYCGYRFLNNDKTDLAIQLFTLNTKLFPSMANTFDSLAEAFVKKGDLTSARKNYQKVLELEPGNEKVKKILEDLETR